MANNSEIPINFDPDIKEQALDGLSAITEFDNALTSMSYNRKLQMKELDEIAKNALQAANQFHTSVEASMEIFQMYANMYTNSREILEAATPTIMLSSLTQETPDVVANQIETVQNQFHLLAEDAMHIVDVYDYISSQISGDYSQGISNISDAIQSAGENAYLAGLSFEQFFAIAAKAVEQTHLEGSSIGDELNTIFSRLSNAASLSSGTDTQSLLEAKKSLEEIGIAVCDVEGNYRNFNTIMQELSNRWDTLNQTQQETISFNIAATNETNVLSAILSSYTEAMKLADEATRAQNSALENAEKRSSSYAGRLQGVSTAIDSFWIHMLDDDGIKEFISLIGDTIKAVDKLGNTLGMLPTLAGISGGILGAKNIGRVKCNPSQSITYAYSNRLSCA